MVGPAKPRQRRDWPSLVGTDKQRASRGLARLEDITRMISEWVWEADPQGRITYVSERVSEQLGFLPMQLVGKRFSDLGVFENKRGEPMEPDWVHPFRERLFKADDQSGAAKQFLITSAPYYDPDTWGFEGVTGIAEDITERVLKEKNLRDALDAAEQASRAKSEFLSTISHELRTPLTSIKGSVGILRGFMAKDLSEEGLGLLEICSRNADTLIVLINDILDYEKTQSGMMTLSMQPHDVDKLCEYVIGLSESYAKIYGVRFVLEPCSDELWANLDEHRWAQVLRNLLSNAAKFSHVGAQVDISIRKIEQTVRISIKDHGVGIPLEAQAMIFDRFVQADSSDSRKHMGSGLGLSISRALVEAMNGSINFESELGKGSNFFVEFPVIAAP